jgi:hypothetical protein
MDRRKTLGIGTIAAACVLSIVAISVSFAAYTSSLTIKGTGTVKTSKWKVVFKDLGNAQTGNDAGVTSTAKQVTGPSIVGETSIESYKVELKTPGDYVYYDFKISNDGDFPAKIDTGFSMPTPSCTKGASGSDSDATNVCGNLTYTLNYVNNGTVGAAVASGDTFAVGQSKDVRLKIYYKKTATTAQLPKDDVTIGNLNITIPFVQY